MTTSSGQGERGRRHATPRLRGAGAIRGRARRGIVIRMVILLAGMLAILGWCHRRVGVGDVVVGETVTTRPPTAIGEPGWEGDGPWIAVRLSLNKRVLSTLQYSGMTFAAEIDDCAGRHLDTEDIYVSGQPLWMLSAMGHGAFRAWFARQPRHVTAVAYLDRQLVDANLRLCAHLRGGSMLGQTIRSSPFQLKPALKRPAVTADPTP